MRLGAYAAILKPETQIYRAYERSGRIENDSERLIAFENNPGQKFRLGRLKKSQKVVFERHRHRYEVNPEFIDTITANGLVFSGSHIRNDGTVLMEFIELPGHKCFIATQAHPEFTSRLGNPNPMFMMFVNASAGGEA